MSETVVAQVNALHRMTLPELQQKWLETFGEETAQRDRQAMWQRLAQKIQEDGMSDDEREQVETGRKAKPTSPASPSRKPKKQNMNHDRRVPPAGTVLTRQYKGHEVAVTVLEKGFEFDGQVYRSLSAIAREITGTPWNGYVFFGLGGKR